MLQNLSLNIISSNQSMANEKILDAYYLKKGNKMHLHEAGLKNYYYLPRLNPGHTVFEKHLPQHLISYMFS